MPLNTTKTIPPGGWVFEQKTPAGTIKKFSSMEPFGNAVNVIAAYRKGNGIQPYDFESVAMELEQQTCVRLGHNPKYCESKKKSLLEKLHILPAHVKKAVELAGSVTNGARILSDWLGAGAVAVNRSLAQARANICLGCPQNLESHGVMKLTDAIGAAILEQRRKKSDMDLEVIGEPGLHTCNVCACHLPLKVWVPMATIANRTHPKLVEKFPDFCWMKTETEKPKETPCQTPRDGPLQNPPQSSPSISAGNTPSKSSVPVPDTTTLNDELPSSTLSEPSPKPSPESTDFPSLKSSPNSETSTTNATV